MNALSLIISAKKSKISQIKPRLRLLKRKTRALTTPKLVEMEVEATTVMKKRSVNSRPTLNPPSLTTTKHVNLSVLKLLEVSTRRKTLKLLSTRNLKKITLLLENVFNKLSCSLLLTLRK